MCRKLLIACFTLFLSVWVMPYKMVAANACTEPILTDLTYQTVCEGASFQPVTVSVTNGVTSAFQWYNDKGDANPTTTAIAGQTGANLTVLPTTIGIYKYKIVATNTIDGACQAFKMVTLVIAPLIPARELCGGETFTATAQSGLTNIQWSVDLGSGYNPISGATNAALTITAVGRYKYSAQDASGCVIELCCPIEIKTCSVCKDDIVKVDTLTQYAKCNEDSLTVCLPIRFDESYNYNIFNGLTLYNAQREGCDFDTLFQYNYFVLPNQGANGPYRLDYWNANGKTFTAASITSMQQLVDSMNVWDPAGAWALDVSNLSIVGGLKTNDYRDMRFTTLRTGAISIIRLNLNIVSRGTRLKFKVQNTPQTIVFENIATGCKDTLIVKIIPNPANIPPLALFDGISTLEDAPISVAVLLNDRDSDSEINPSSLAITQLPTHGTASINPDGSIKYTPFLNFNGTDSLIYTICDACSPAACDTAIVYFTVNPVNDPIVANVDGATTNQDTPVTISIKNNDNDPDGDLTVAIITITEAPRNGLITVLPDGTLSYTPNTGFHGIDTLIYRLCDVGTPQLCDTAIVFIEIEPTCVDDIIKTDVLTYTGKCNEDSLTVCLPIMYEQSFNYKIYDNNVQLPSGAGGCDFDTLFQYNYFVLPGRGATGPYRLDYWNIGAKTYTIASLNSMQQLVDSMNVWDAAGQWALNTNDLSIVGGVKTTPYADMRFTTLRTGAVSLIRLNLNIVGRGTRLKLKTGTHNIVLENINTGCKDKVTINTIPDSNNKPPLATRDQVSTLENSKIGIAVLANDFDLDSDIDTSSLQVSTQATHGTATIKANGIIEYTPNLDFFGIDSLIYTLCDKCSPAACDTAIVYITVNRINKAPVANPDIVSTDNNTPISETVASNDTDSDTPKEDLTYILLGNVPNTEGGLAFNPDGIYTFTPNRNFVGTVKISYKVCDTTPLCDTAFLTITVKKAPCGDILADKTISVNAACTADSADVCIAISRDSISPYKLFVDRTLYQAGFSACNYDTAYNYNYFVVRGRGFAGAYKVEWTVNGTTLTIPSVIDFKALVDTLNRLDVGGNWRLNLATYNILGGKSANNYGTLKVTQTRTRSVSLLNRNTRLDARGTVIRVKSGVHELTLDRNGCLDTAQVSVICTVKDRIIANRDNAQTPENEAVTISILTNDTLSTGVINPNTITIVENSRHGSATLHATGAILYTPTLHFNGLDTLIYRICTNGTSTAQCDTALVVIDIKSVNDAPLGNEASVETIEEDPVSGEVTATDIDDEPTTLTHTLLSPPKPSEGEIVFNPDGSFTFQPAPNFSGTVIILTKVCDSKGLCDTVNLTINVVKKPCEDIIAEKILMTHVCSSNGKEGEICLNMPKDTISNYKLLVDGQVYTKGLTNCRIDTLLNYNYFVVPNKGINGPYSVEWVANGTTLKISSVRNMKELVDSLNKIDAPNHWRLHTPTYTITSDKTNNGYGLLTIKQIKTGGKGLLQLNKRTIIKQSAIKIDKGSHILTFVKNNNACRDSAQVVVACVKPETKWVEVQLGKKDTLCLDIQELTGKDIKVISTCTPANENVVFSILPNSTCITLEGKKAGQTDLCFAVCDENGVCDTTFIYAKVKEAKIKASNDSVTVRFNTPVKINVMGNDSASGAGNSTIAIVDNPNHGTAVVGSDGSINYIPNKDYCSSKPDSLRYVVCNTSGCDTAYVRVTILCEDVKFYTGFSPNNDGLNEVFFIEGLEKYPNNRLCIYNRWGNQILEVHGYKNDWDGKWNGKILPDGTYFYLFDKGDGDSQMYSGYLQIQR